MQTTKFYSYFFNTWWEIRSHFVQFGLIALSGLKLGNGPGGGGYSLYLGIRDDRHIVKISDLVFFRGCLSVNY